jgi:hypothetical protein
MQPSNKPAISLLVSFLPAFSYFQEKSMIRLVANRIEMLWISPKMIDDSIKWYAIFLSSHDYQKGSTDTDISRSKYN